MSKLSKNNIASYDYDQLGALTKADSNSYAYDKVSNRTTDTMNGAKTDYTIDTSSNRLLASTFNSIKSDYQYDTAGNIIKAKDMSYTYDNLNRLQTVSKDDKQLASYHYNSFSQRIMKDVNGNKTIFIYNSAGQLLEERNLAQNVTKDYIYAEGQLIAVAENGQVIYIITDHLNAPQLALDSTGRSIWSAKYSEFGKATIISNYKLNLRADGQYQDDETGLYYNWYRYYNPDLGRYITSDPLGLAGGMNTYVYVNGDPINYTDPMGLETYQCTIPLKNLKFLYDQNVSYAFHQYSCFRNNPTYGSECGGQDRTTSMFGSNGKASDDVFNPKEGHCKRIMPNNSCYETCLHEEWAKPRPWYNIIPKDFSLVRKSFDVSGTNCQDCDNQINALCKKQCGK